MTEIRSRLLDFVLNLQERLGGAEESEVKEVAKSIDAPAMFHHTVFGDNATIVVGNQNITTVTNMVKKGDFSSLAAALKSNGVPDEDITALQTAIEQDKNSIDPGKKQFGSSVKGWMSRMMKKAIDNSWQIELGVAGNLLADALKAYYF